MPAKVLRLATKPDRLRADQAAHLRQLVLDLDGAPAGAISEILAVIDRRTAAEKGWTFIMLSPDQNRTVVNWLAQHSALPIQAMRLWAELFTHMRMDTGEVVASRQQLAEAVGCAVTSVSAIMSELEGIGAISRVRDGKTMRYFMNPKVGTCLSGAAREKAQADAPALRLIPPAIAGA